MYLVISGAGNNLATAVKLVQRMVNLYQKQGMSGLYGIWLWERARCQAAWDAVPLEERTGISEQGCFPLLTPCLYSVQRPGMLPGLGNKQYCTNKIGKSCILANISKEEKCLNSFISPLVFLDFPCRMHPPSGSWERNYFFSHLPLCTYDMWERKILLFERAIPEETLASLK